MADIAAQRREARRLKILQNGQARINRLMGNDATATNDTHVKENHDPEDTPNGSPPATAPDTGSSPPYNLRHRTPRSEDPSSRDSTQSSAPSSPSTTQDSENHAGARLPSASSNPASRVGQPRMSGPKSWESSKPSGNAGSLELIYMASCIITALGVRLMLEAGVGFFYFQSVLLPFALMESVLAYLSHSLFKHLAKPAPRGSMWATALVLCGLKQELVTAYTHIMASVASVAGDFCFFLFAFVTWDAVIGLLA